MAQLEHVSPVRLALGPLDLFVTPKSPLINFFDLAQQDGPRSSGFDFQIFQVEAVAWPTFKKWSI
jgi:hypothetical protein